MERWNFRCQICGKSIGTPWYVDEYWYVCPWRTGWLRLDPKPDLEGLTYHHHKIASGWGRLGYTICARCATKAKEPKCPTCRAPLIRVHADQHPGGSGWGIRGEFDRIYVRHQVLVHKNLRNYNFFYKFDGGTIMDAPIPKREPAPMR